MRDETALDADSLVVLAGGGVVQAFAGFYRLVFGRVYETARAVLVDQAQAEEVAQEVMLEAWLTAARFDPVRAQASTWVNLDARRRAIDRVRASQSSRVRDLRVGIRDGSPVEPDIAEALEAVALHGATRLAIRALPREQRIILVQHFYENLSVSVLASTHNIAESTVRWRIRAALTKLRLALTDSTRS